MRSNQKVKPLDQASRPPKGQLRAQRAGLPTRKRIISAALKTLKRDGFAGTSARVIARTGRFNPALIFYHFGSVHDLLLAALEETSRTRMNRYEELIADVRTLPELMRAAAQLYEEDLSAGHITVLAEMIAGASSIPELGPQIAEMMEPWVGMTQEALQRVLGGTPLEQLAPPAQMAFVVVALYLGMEMLTHLTKDASATQDVFKAATDFAAVMSGEQVERDEP
jgi:AcrR family transcriptional regulator